MKTPDEREAIPQKLAQRGDLLAEVRVPLADLSRTIAALHHGMRRVGSSNLRQARGAASAKLKLRVCTGQLRRRQRSAR